MAVARNGRNAIFRKWVKALISHVKLVLMEQEVKRNLKRALGIFLIIFGLAGMILPILPGWWVALIGLEILGWRLVIDRHKPWRKIFSLKEKIQDNNP